MQIHYIYARRHVVTLDPNKFNNMKSVLNGNSQLRTIILVLLILGGHKTGTKLMYP